MRISLRATALVAVAALLAGARVRDAAPASVAPATPAAGSPAAGGDAWAGVDDGTKLTMWTRAATQARSEALVEAYNAIHKNQIEMTVVPTDDYQTKVGAAARLGRAARPLLGRRRVHAELDVRRACSPT